MHRSILLLNKISMWRMPGYRPTVWCKTAALRRGKSTRRRLRRRQIEGKKREKRRQWRQETSRSVAATATSPPLLRQLTGGRNNKNDRPTVPPSTVTVAILDCIASCWLIAPVSNSCRHSALPRRNVWRNGEYLGRRVWQYGIRRCWKFETTQLCQIDHYHWARSLAAVATALHVGRSAARWSASAAVVSMSTEICFSQVFAWTAPWTRSDRWLPSTVNVKLCPCKLLTRHMPQKKAKPNSNLYSRVRN